MANITISTALAEQLYDLFHNVEVADVHYKRCQSDQFRVHVQSVYKNPGVSEAFASLRSQIDAANAEPKVERPTRAAERPRKSVLGD